MTERQKPYWHDGLRFTCTRCGACCQGAPGTIYFSPSELDALAAHLGEDRDALCQRAFVPYRDSYSARDDFENGRCYFYDPQKGCTIYAFRPMQCRTYPFWRCVLRDEAYWDELATECPGINEGECHEAREISQIASRSPI